MNSGLLLTHRHGPCPGTSERRRSVCSAGITEPSSVVLPMVHELEGKPEHLPLPLDIRTGNIPNIPDVPNNPNLYGSPPPAKSTHQPPRCMSPQPLPGQIVIYFQIY